MKQRAGFTLVELLVVIAIIGIIASILLTTLNQSRIKSRDGRRVADIKQLQLAIELYNSNNSTYPRKLIYLVNAGLIPSISTDPQTKTAYFYVPYVTQDFSNTCIGDSEVCGSYHLGANIEDANALVLRSDADADAGAGGIRGLDSDDCSASASGKHCYDLRP